MSPLVTTSIMCSVISSLLSELCRIVRGNEGSILIGGIPTSD